MWIAVQDSLEDVRNSILDPANDDHFMNLLELARDLEAISMLNGFKELMLPKLTDKKRWSEFPNFAYEARIAAVHASVGQEVTFIPTREKEGIKAPDIGVGIDGSTIRIECKRRDRITPLVMSQDKKNHYRERMHKDMGSVVSDFAYMLFMLGEPSDMALDNALSHIEEFAKSGERGFAGNPDAGVWFLVFDHPPIQQASPGLTLFLPSVYPNSWAGSSTSCRFYLDKDRKMQMPQWRTSHMFNFKSHAFKQLTYSFDQGKNKFSNTEKGVIYIDVDPAGMIPPVLDWYLDVMCYALADLAWRGGQNKRIAAIVLTAGPIRPTGEEGGSRQRLSFYISRFRILPGLTNEGDPESLAVIKMLRPLGGPAL